MKFSFSVRDNEKRTVTYNFNQLWGKLIIKVDDKDIVETLQMWKSPFSTKQPVTFAVRDKEKHSIKIEKTCSQY